MKVSLNTHKMIMGYIIIGAVVLLVGIIGLGHVEEKTSFGLTSLISVLGTLAGAFCNWAFGNKSSDSKEE